MASKSKNKGSRVEREVVNLAKNSGLKALRAYASDGRSLGLDSTVDVLIGDYKVQVKAKKKFPSWLLEAEKGVDIVVLKEDNKPYRALITLELLLELIK